MNLIGDFHTHTTYTHGTSTIEENVRQAENLGLEYLAITEHSYNSIYHIMPISGFPAGAAGAGAGISVTAHSVVRMRAAIEAAF